MSRSITNLGVLACLVFASTGCGGSTGLATAPVSGTVTLDGKPVEDAEIHFFTEEFDAVGVTDSEGRYELVQGAVPGANKVYITKRTGGAGQSIPEDSAEAMEAGVDEGQLEAIADASGGTLDQDLPRELIPEEFSDPDRTKLTYNVPEGGTDTADFRLKSQ